jgi:hypothetical protein
VRRLGLLGVLAVLAVPAGSGVRPLPLHAQPAATPTLLGIVGAAKGSRLAEIDPATLQAGRTSELVPYIDSWVRSPDGSRLAVATNTRGNPADPKLRFFDPSTLQWAPQVVDLDCGLSSALWPSADRIVAFADCGNGYGSVETIDAAAGKVVARTSVRALVTTIRRSADGLVMLAVPNAGLAPARLLTVGPDARVRSVTLARIRVGTRWNEGTRIGTMREPGLAVDTAGGIAYVADGGGLVARVDLRDLSVTYHTPAKTLLDRFGAWLTPPAQAKAISGPSRTAVWLGDGLLAVTGADYFATRKRGTYVVSNAPAGLRVIDTRDWTARTIDPEASSLALAEGVLLTAGGRYRSNSTGTGTISTGEGIAAYGTDGRLRWRIDAGASRVVISTYGSVALTWKSGADPYDVIDLASGKLVRAAASYVTLLLGPGT